LILPYFRANMQAMSQLARSTSDQIELRLATAADQPALAVLAQLDAKPVPQGPTLIVALEGRIAAAFPLDGGVPIADPFRPTADLLQLLEVRAAQLWNVARRDRRLGLRRLLPRTAA
jgi:hypothetical protein